MNVIGEGGQGKKRGMFGEEKTEEEKGVSYLDH